MGGSRPPSWPIVWWVSPHHHLQFLPNQVVHRVTFHVHICILVRSFNKWPYQSIPVSVVFINTAYGPAISNFMETTKDCFPLTKHICPHHFLSVNSPVVHFQVTISYGLFPSCFRYIQQRYVKSFSNVLPPPLFPIQHYLFSGYPDPWDPFLVGPHLPFAPDPAQTTEMCLAIPRRRRKKSRHNNRLTAHGDPTCSHDNRRTAHLM